MKERFLCILMAAVFVGATACSPEPTACRETIPLVKSIIDDGSCPGYLMLSSHEKPEIQGNIYIIGSEERCSMLTDMFMVYDRNDNVDGSPVQDGLPDFAGETASAVIDVFNAPYVKYIVHSDEDRLREINVSNFLMAVDTVCYLSPYDMEGMSSKTGAKIVIFTSPYADAFGMFDIDTLLRSTSCSIKVISPLTSMLEHLFLTHDANLNVGIIPNSDVLAGTYEAVFNAIAEKFGRSSSRCVVYPTADEDDPVRSFLDNYLADGKTGKLDAILLDDFNVSIDDAEASLESLISVMSELSLTYGNCIAPGFEMMESQTAVLENCFEYLRKTNTFTHNIHYPKSEYFITVKSPDPDSLSYKLMRYDEKFVQE